MARICVITGRRPVKGSIINRKGQSKKSGGIGTHVTSITKRKFRPNLQRIRIRMRMRCRLRSEEHTSELQSRVDLVCRLLLEKKKKKTKKKINVSTTHTEITTRRINTQITPSISTSNQCPKRCLNSSILHISQGKQLRRPPAD